MWKQLLLAFVWICWELCSLDEKEFFDGEKQNTGHHMARNICKQTTLQWPDWVVSTMTHIVKLGNF